MHYLKFTILLFFVLLASCHTHARLDVAKLDRSRVLKQANEYLDSKPVTVTADRAVRSAGGIHDFYSEGDYWWPDPENPDGPYIRKDGQTNPDNFVAHRKAMRRLSLIVPALVAAYKLTQDEKYAAQAVKHLKAWFVDTTTMMNPNLLYSQAIKGRVTGRGIGIIDTIHLVEVVQAMQVLRQMGYLKGDLEAGLEDWFRKYLHWITTHPYGLAERNNGNNHSTCWAMQVASFAGFVHDEKELQACRQFYKNHLLPEQMAKNGSFPKELKRTKPYGYSLFNLDAMAMVCQLASTPGDDLWHYSTSDGRNMKLGMAFMFPYIKDKSSWPYPPDVMYFDDWPMRQPSLLFAGIEFKNQEYLNLWKTLPADSNVDEVLRNFFIRQPLLWVEGE